MPDFKKDKKKTKSIHDSINPVYDDLYEKINSLFYFIMLFLYRFEWSAALADIHRQHLYISVKNNSPVFTQEQTYMGDVCIVFFSRKEI